MSRIGSLRRQITIQVAAETLDDFGHPVSTWTTHKVVPAAVKAVSQIERVLADAIDNPVVYQFTIRHDPTITPDMRVLYNGQPYGIRGVIPADDYDKYIRLDAISVV